MMPTAAPLPQPLDVAALVEASRPGAGQRRLGMLVPVAWVIVVISAASQRSGGEQAAVSLLAIVVTLGVSTVLRAGMRAGLREQQALLQMEDRLALKHTPAVAAAAAQVLARPMRSVENRLRALILLATALSRLDRQDEALALYDQLLDGERVGGPGAAVVRVARAMSLLRADRLFDADRAISDLRQRLKRPSAERRAARIFAADGDDGLADDGDSAVADSPDVPVDFSAEATGELRGELPGGFPGRHASDDRQLFAATRLVELYRDVKTGHADDALTLFETDKQSLRESLGHRYGEALALAAAAHDRLSHTAEAAEMFANATALLPAVELIRKYPEIAGLTAKYPVTPPPPRR